MSVIARWGTKTWEVNNSTVKAIEDLAFSYEQQADNNSSTEGKALTNQRGLELFGLTFSTVLHSGVGIDVRSEIDSWKDLVTKTGYFYLNDRQLGPNLQLRKVSVGGTKLDNFGRIRLATLNFEFKEYETAATTSVKGTTTSAVGVTASSEAKEKYAAVNSAVKKAATAGIKVGDYVYPTGTKYYTGETIPTAVKRRSHVVSQISGGKTLLGSPDGINKWVYSREISLA